MLQRIEAWAFSSGERKSIRRPARIDTLGADCFAQCKALQAVTFEVGSRLATIAVSAFGQTGIAEISIPAPVATLGQSCCANASVLQSVLLEPGSALRRIPERAFIGTGFNTVEIPELSRNCREVFLIQSDRVINSL
jgi:hypothetical protein